MPNANVRAVKGKFAAKPPLLLAILFALCCLPSVALAHKVNVWAYAEGDTVLTESYFSDGRKCQHCTITVYDGEGNKLLEGKTDTEGSFSFRAPVKTDLLIVLDAGMGHRAEYKLSASDLPDTLPTVPSREGKKAPQTPMPGLEESVPPPEQSPGAPGAKIPIAELEQVVEKVLEKKFAPIRQMLVESQMERPSFTEIVGGIGYIMGIMGLVMYFKSRKPQHAKDEKE